MGYIKGLCNCGNQQESKGRVRGKQVFGRYCTSCRKQRHLIKAILNSNNKCQLCGFKAKNKVQLDIDHIDGNHTNNDETNLQVICANCHRLKTYNNKDWENKY